MEKPIDGAKYKIFGSDTYGDYELFAICKYYSTKNPKSLSKSQRRYGYKWLSLNGEIIPHHDVERFELVSNGI